MTLCPIAVVVVANGGSVVVASSSNMPNAEARRFPPIQGIDNEMAYYYYGLDSPRLLY